MIRTMLLDKHGRIHTLTGEPKRCPPVSPVKMWVEKEGLDGIFLQDLSANATLLAYGFPILENKQFVEAYR